MAEDFEKTVKLTPGGAAPAPQDTEKTVKLNVEPEKPIKLSPAQSVSETYVAPVESLLPPVHDSHASRFNPIKIAVIFVVAAGLLGGAWFALPGFLLKKSMGLSKSGDHAKAAQLLKFAVKIHPLKEPVYRTALGKEQRLSSDLLGAQASQEKVLAKDPNNYEAARELGLTFKAQGQNQKAFEYLRSCADKNPEDREALIFASQLAYDLKDYTNAAALYGALTLSGGDAEDFSKLGFALHETNKDEDAISALLKSLEKSQTLKGVAGLLAKIYKNQNDFESALAYSEKELKVSPGDIDMINILAESSLRAAGNAASGKKFSDAAGFLERGLKVSSSESANMHYEAARIYSILKKKKDVLAHLADAFAINGALKSKARKDRAFSAYQKSPDFRKLTK